MQVLVMNAGSSSHKSCLYDIQGISQAPEPVWQGMIDWSHRPGMAELEIKTAKTKVTQILETADRRVAIAALLATLHTGGTQVIDNLSAINAVGHRVVHGGPEYSQSVVVDNHVKNTIQNLIPLAPAHNPANLLGIEIITELLPQVAQVAVFDTAFHNQMPPANKVYPLPYELYERGIRRYGFHGINHCYCAERVGQLLNIPDLRLITCHLGNGCSLAAVKGGVSINTSMGFTPLEGLMMGSRSGTIDPGIILYLIRQGYTIDRLEQLLNRESGLLGVSGISNDMRSLQGAIDQGNERAKLAFTMFIERLRSAIAAFVPQLDGLDALVFTGGIGEHHRPTRAHTCAGLGFLGLVLDPELNQGGQFEQNLATPESKVKVFAIKAQEDWAIAKECWHLLAG